EIRKRRARRPKSLQQTGLGRYIDEFSAAPAVALVVEKCQSLPPRDQQIRPAVAVVVGDGDAVRVEIDAVEAGLLGHILELPAAQVLVEFARMAADHLALRPGELAAASEKEIGQAVAIVVDDAHAAAERFERREMSGLFAVAV